jgi:hypothetical protein
MSDTQIEYLNKLQAAAEKACRKAYRNRELIDGAVNWADLHCHEAKYCIDNHGHSYYEVVIEEASPSSDNLRRFIQEIMDADGFDVMVSLEW